MSYVTYYSGRDYRNLIIILLILGVIALVAWKFYSDKKHEHVIDKMGVRVEKMNSEIKELKRKIELRKEIQAYTDKLPIKNLHIIDTKGSLKVYGDIVNKGSRKIDDIQLTVFCLDKNDRVIFDEQYLASSHDKSPLRKNQYRSFRMNINNVPDALKEVWVVISDIEFND